MPAGFVVFFQNGPLAWNGMLSRWLLLVGFFSWVVVVTAVMLSNLRGQGRSLVTARVAGRAPA